MKDMYQDLVEDVSAQIAQRLLGNREWIDEHRLMLDERVFELMMLIGLSALERIFVELASQKIETLKESGMTVHKRGTIDMNTRMGQMSEVPSPTLRHRGTGETVRPMKQTFGLRGNGKTLSLERALSDFGSENSYGEAERMFERRPG